MTQRCQKHPQRPVVPLYPSSFQPRQPGDFTHKHKRETPKPGLFFDLCDGDLHATYREHMLAKYGAESTQPDPHFIHASRDWTESPVLHRPFPFLEAQP